MIKQAIEEELATQTGIPHGDAELEEWIREQMWEPKYRPLVKVDASGASRHAKGEMGIGGRCRASDVHEKTNIISE